jgi:hypothetical protein
LLRPQNRIQIHELRFGHLLLSFLLLSLYSYLSHCDR